MGTRKSGARAPKPGSRQASAAANTPAAETDDGFHEKMTAGRQGLLRRSQRPGASGSARKAVDADADMEANGFEDDVPVHNNVDASDAPVGTGGRRGWKRAKDMNDSERDALREERRKRKRTKKANEKMALSEDGTVEVRPGVMYLGHIPHGFYERELRGFFKQFGEVSRLRLSRARSSGKSKGYAFVEFANEEVARIAAEAMDGYLMFGRALSAKIVEPDDVHPRTFDGAKRTFTKIDFSARERAKNLSAARDPSKLASRAKAVVASHEATRKRLQKLGIDYKFPSLPAVVTKEVR